MHRARPLFCTSQQSSRLTKICIHTIQLVDYGAAQLASRARRTCIKADSPSLLIPDAIRACTSTTCCTVQHCVNAHPTPVWHEAKAAAILCCCSCCCCLCGPISLVHQHHISHLHDATLYHLQVVTTLVAARWQINKQHNSSSRGSKRLMNTRACIARARIVCVNADVTSSQWLFLVRLCTAAVSIQGHGHV
jgi:hypothetical protein